MLRGKFANFVSKAKNFGLRALNTYNKVNAGIRQFVKHAGTARDVYGKVSSSLVEDETVPAQVRQVVSKGRGYIDELHKGIGRGYEVQQNFDEALRKSLPVSLR